MAVKLGSVYMLIIGAALFDDCSALPHLTLYMVVFGTVATVNTILAFVLRVRTHEFNGSVGCSMH